MNKKLAFTLSLLITLLIASNIILFKYLNQSQKQTVVISRIIDGDTLETQQGLMIRLENINSPEKNQPGYEQAKNFLLPLVNTTVEIQITGTDKYYRTLAKIYTPKYLNLEIVEKGLAKKYLVDDQEAPLFAEAEAQAIHEKAKATMEYVY